VSEAGDPLATLNAERARLARPSGLPAAKAIRDAGTLLIVDDSNGTARVLMGRRSTKHVFMPGRYVFPGGRVDPSDLALARDFALSEPAFDRLCAGPPARYDRRRATATALAAIRETSSQVVVFLDGDLDAIYVRGEGVLADNLTIFSDDVFQVV